jgi:hypothetical protein
MAPIIPVTESYDAPNSKYVGLVAIGVVPGCAERSTGRGLRLHNDSGGKNE